MPTLTYQLGEEWLVVLHYYHSLCPSSIRTSSWTKRQRLEGRKKSGHPRLQKEHFNPPFMRILIGMIQKDTGLVKSLGLNTTHTSTVQLLWVTVCSLPCKVTKSLWTDGHCRSQWGAHQMLASCWLAISTMSGQVPPEWPRGYPTQTHHYQKPKTNKQCFSKWLPRFEQFMRVRLLMPPSRCRSCNDGVRT